MGGRPQKREKASGRKEWELGSTWNLKWTHVGIMGFSVYYLCHRDVAWNFKAPQMRGYFYFLPLYSSLHIKATTVATTIMPSSKIPNTMSQFITVSPRALGSYYEGCLLPHHLFLGNGCTWSSRSSYGQLDYLTLSHSLIQGLCTPQTRGHLLPLLTSIHLGLVIPL